MTPTLNPKMINVLLRILRFPVAVILYRNRQSISAQLYEPTCRHRLYILPSLMTVVTVLGPGY